MSSPTHRPWSRPRWIEPRLWIFVMGGVLFLPWCVVAPSWAAAGPQPPLPALLVLLENPFVEGPGSFLVYGLGAVIALVLAVAAYIATSRGRHRVALVASTGYVFVTVSFVLLLASAHAISVTDLAVTPLAATVLVSIPAVATLAHAFVAGVPEVDRPRIRGRVVAVDMALAATGALGWAIFAGRVVFYVPAGLSDRTYPELAVFLAGMGILAYVVVAMVAVALATRETRTSGGPDRSEDRMPDPYLWEKPPRSPERR